MLHKKHTSYRCVVEDLDKAQEVVNFFCSFLQFFFCIHRACKTWSAASLGDMANVVSYWWHLKHNAIFILRRLDQQADEHTTIKAGSVV